MIRGSCLCGAVRFELDRIVGPFELCHCNRCRKATGSAFAAGVGAQIEDFRLTAGADLIESYEAPILEQPPAYRTSFCRRCGSPVPNPAASSGWFEIAAGVLDDDPGCRPDRHIFVELKPAWHAITDALPQLDKSALIEQRLARLTAHERRGGSKPGKTQKTRRR